MSNKNEPTENFFKISHRTIKGDKFKKLNPGAKILYLYLCSHRNTYGDENGIFFRSDRHLAEDTGMAIATVGRAKKELIGEGYLRWEKGDFAHACKYQLNEEQRG